VKTLAIALLVFIAGPAGALAQAKPATFETYSEIVWAGVDRSGDLFLVLKSGDVQKFDKNGKKIGSHTFKEPPRIFDPLDGTQSFYFLAGSNTYGNLSSDLVDVSEKTLDPSFAVSPTLVCPALHELWILDSTDLSLGKTKAHASVISFENSLQALSKKKPDFVNMREYQNYLFLLDRNNGIHMFNGLGKYIKTIAETGLGYFSFLGEEIYFIKGNQVVLTDLYTGEQRMLPIPTTANFILLTDDRLFAVDSKKVSIFDFKP
jgi:hypothetical protein